MSVNQSVSRLDTFYRRMVLSQFFTKGWGCPRNMKRLIEFRKYVSNRDNCIELVSKDPKFELIKDERYKEYRVLEYKFRTPLDEYLPGIIPADSRTAYFQMVIPNRWKSSTERPLCIHLAGTGDHYFFRRRAFMANPLLKSHIGSIILENPFYGLRKPRDQVRSCLHNVSDIFVMGGCLILECLAILRWAERRGYGPLGLSGISMGGHMASLAATNWPKPLVCVPCLSWTTASSVFTRGVMAKSINWELLQNQYTSHPLYYEIRKLARIIDKQEQLCSLDCEEYLLNADVSNYGAGQGGSSKYSTAILKAIGAVKYSTVMSNIVHNSKPLEAVQFMQAIMDECTHLRNFSQPFEPSLAVVIAARHDAYIPKEGLTSIEQVWPGATVRYLDAGHVAAYLYYLRFFRRSIVEVFDRAAAIARL